MKDYYNHLECDCFDIAHYKVGGKGFDIIKIISKTINELLKFIKKQLK